MADTDDSFVSLLIRRTRVAPRRVYARFDGTAITFADVNRMSSALARWFAEQGLVPGDRVAVMLSNSPASVAVLFGLGKAGMVWVPINVRSRGDNLAYIFSHCEPRLLIAEDRLVADIQASGIDLAGMPMWMLGEPTATRALEPVLARAEGLDAKPPEPDDLLAIMYSSGTTGRPKGVLVSHRMLRLSGEGAALVSAAEDGDVLLLWEPLYHIGGAQMVVLPLIRDVELAMVDRFSASRFWSQARARGATHMHYLGGILQMLLKQPPGALDRAHGIRVAWGGGCPRDIWRAFEDRFGVEIHECYGMTETSSITTWNERRVLGSVGRPVPWLSIELEKPRGQSVRAGEAGEIVVRSKLPGAITRGYFRDPRATAEALRGGAFYTGDIGSLDTEGNLYFHGRMTDNVRVRGENVSAFEVEHVAAKHPAVEDCAMLGVAAEVGEQDIKLFVKLRPDTAIDPAALSQWLATRLAPHQNPRYIAVVADFERTPSQRIMKHKLSTRSDDAWDRTKDTPGSGNRED
jgi:crotonobetaine/carnitine-CoA ligase